MYQAPNVPFSKASAPMAPGPAGPAAAQPQQSLSPNQSNPRLGQSIASTLEVTFLRLEEVVEQETAELRAGGRVDIAAFNARKSQALLELTRMLRQVRDAQSNEALVKRMGSLQSKLAINRAVLKMHVEAVREISTTLADAIREAESDGTYTPSIYSGAKRQ